MVSVCFKSSSLSVHEGKKGKAERIATDRTPSLSSHNVVVFNLCMFWRGAAQVRTRRPVKTPWIISFSSCQVSESTLQSPDRPTGPFNFNYADFYTSVLKDLELQQSNDPAQPC